jgi:hypothetical protein
MTITRVSASRARGAAGQSVRLRVPPHRAHAREVGIIPKDCKRLAEVNFPIAEAPLHAARNEGFAPPALTVQTLAS